MMDYEVHYKNVKNLTLRIGPSGMLQVTAPRKMSKAYIEKVILQKGLWIAQHQQRIEQLQQQRQESGLVNRYGSDGWVAYLGQMYPLQVEQAGKRNWHWTGDSLQLAGCSTELHCQQLVEAFYRQQMLEEIVPAFNQQVRRRLSELQLPMPAFTIRKMRASWGLCYSKEEKIVLNLWLAMAPPECIRQVLIHEYLHFCQNNHSSKFYALLEQFEPQYRQLKHKLSIMVDLQALASTSKDAELLKG